MKIFHKSSAPQLDLETANQILKQTFEANQMKNNSIPLEVLASYSRYRRDRFTLQRTILVMIMVLLLLLPLLFVPSSFTVKEDHTLTRNYNPVYKLHVDSFMPVQRINVSINGHNIPAYEIDTHVYSIEPSQNGQMEVTVTLINKQNTTQYIDVTTVDRELPIATSCTKRGDFMYLYLSDNESGVDFQSIKTTDLNGQEVMPASIEEITGCVVFPVVESALNVYVSDLAGNQLQLILSIK